MTQIGSVMTWDPNDLNFGGSRLPGLSFNQGPLDMAKIDTNQLVPMPRVSMAPTAGAGGLTAMNKASMALGGLETIGNLFMAFQANKLAKKQFRFQRDFANANLANSIKSYNTALEDRIRSRSFTEGRPSGYADEYIARNRMENTMPQGKGK